MALNAVLEVANAFFNVLTPDFVGRVFVAAIAGIAAVVVANVAGDAFRVVISVQHEIRVVIEGRGQPLILAMALAAIAGDLPMERILGRLMTRLAFLADIARQQGMVEPPFDPVTAHARVIAMAGEAILLHQLLVKRRFGERLLDRHTQGGEFADVGGLMAANAAFGRNAGERCVAGKTVGFKGAVTGNESAGAHHQMGIDKRQHREGDEVRRQNEFEGFAHCHPQNKNMLMM